MKQILYLHGFLSCGAAVKASTLSSYVKEHCPVLGYYVYKVAQYIF